jgi:hypothetical protein
VTQPTKEKKVWIVTRGSRRAYRRGYSHAHSRKLLREMDRGYRVWWEMNREALQS